LYFTNFKKEVFKRVDMERMERFVDWDNTPWTGIVFEKEIILKIWFLDKTRLMMKIIAIIKVV